MNFASRSLVILLVFGPWIFSSLAVKQMPQCPQPEPELNSNKSPHQYVPGRGILVCDCHSWLSALLERYDDGFFSQKASSSDYSLEPLRHPVGNSPQQVNGILGGSVSFPANVSQGIIVKKIEWDFRPKSGGLAFRLSEYRHGKPDHPNPTDRFGERLNMANQKILRIKDLELNDSGIYEARVWFTKSLFQGQSFSLTVYEPVPTPQIDHHVESKTPGGCNVTLRCHTPGREELNISWETGNPHRALGKSVNQYQISDNGQELRVFYWKSSFDSKFTCLVSNHVDQKGALFDLLNICQTDEDRLFRLSSWSPWLIPSITVLLVTVVMVMAM